eukprot:3018666-Amphidinium_carterae.1
MASGCARCCPWFACRRPSMPYSTSAPGQPVDIAPLMHWLETEVVHISRQQSQCQRKIASEFCGSVSHRGFSWPHRVNWPFWFIAALEPLRAIAEEML